MSHKLAKLSLITAITVSLSGCAQMSKLSDNMWGHTKNAWGYTKSAANFVASPVTKLLRSAPDQDYVFESAPSSQQQAQTAFANDEGWGASKGLVVPNLAQLPVPQTPNYSSPGYAPNSYQSVYGNPSVRPARIVEAQPKAPLVAPQSSSDISFVKIGGGSNMHDWLMCEAEAGGFVRVVQGGYIIEPSFENCMRGKGYKPESEVADQLSL